MNTTDFLNATKWIVQQYPPQLQQGLLSLNLVHQIIQLTQQKGEGRSTFSDEILRQTYLLPSIAVKLQENPKAIQILKEFELAALLEYEFGLTVAKFVLNIEREQGIGTELYQLVNGMAQKWEKLKSIIGPLENLLIPEPVRGEHPMDEILTIEIRKPEGRQPTIDDLALVLTGLRQLYVSVMEALQKERVAPLEILYFTSGSDFRIDLKGIGDAVKHIKDLFIEGWEKIRHRNADDFRHNSKATIEGLHALDVLEKHRSLDPETKSRIAHGIVESMLDLFKAGALPREIQGIEVVSNDRLMQDMQQRLLPSPAAEGSAPRKRAGKKSK